MRYEIIQTKSYLAAEFEIQNKEGNIGKAVKICEKKVWSFEIEFKQKNFQMVFANSSLPSLKTMFIEMLTFSQPKNDLHRLCIDGKEQGEIFRRWGHYWLELNGCKYSTCTVGFGSEGMKCLVFEGFVDRKDNPTGKQIALIETPNSGQRLDRYQVTARGDMVGLVALLFGLFWDNNAFHKSDTYYEKSYLVSWGKEKNLYDSSFKDSIID